jgi:large subunit ribosomal protein L1
VLCGPDQEAAAKGAGADFVGLDEFVQKIDGGWTDVDVIIATPAVMPKIGRLGKILGPRNLMPNPKTGTVTNDVAAAVTEVKGGKIAFKVDKAGIIHASIGRISFTPEKIVENSTELINAIIKAKPSTAKGTYLKGVSMASTMSPGITVDTKTFVH